MGRYTAQIKGGLFAQYAGSLTSIDLTLASKDHKFPAQNLAHKKNYEFRAIVDTLLGVAPGATATVNYWETPGGSELGGVRTIVNTPIINRATTANDVLDVKETLTSLSSDTYTPNPVYNGDRNPLGTR
jgi:hypothetical protein